MLRGEKTLRVIVVPKSFSKRIVINLQLRNLRKNKAPIRKQRSAHCSVRLQNTISYLVFNFLFVCLFLWDIDSRMKKSPIMQESEPFCLQSH